MMKRTLLFCAFGIAVVSAQAREFLPKGNPKAPQQSVKLQRQLLSKQAAAGNAAKTTATAKRIIGSSTYFDGDLLDSSAYKYKGTFGSSHPNLDSYQGYFDAADPLSVQYIKYDTMWRFGDNGSGFGLVSVATNGYDVNKNLVKQDFFEDMPYERIITNNSNNQRATVLQRDAFTGTYGDREKHFFTYNGQQKVAKDSVADVQANLTQQTIVYSYDGAGNMITVLRSGYNGSMLEPYNKEEYTYDNSNRILTTTYFNYNLGSWEAQDRDTFGYTGVLTQPTYEGYQEWDGSLMAWVTQDNYLYQYNGQGVMTQAYQRQWNGAGHDTVLQLNTVINSAGLYDRVEGLFYIGNDIYSDPILILNMYYQDYDPASVKTVAALAKEMTLYPNPATTNLFVKTEGATIYAVVNMNGQLLIKANAERNGQHLNVANLPAGNYIVTAQDAQGAVLSSKLFSKQ